MLSSDRVRWSERRRLRGCSGGDFWLCCAGWKWAGVTLMITFTTAQSLLWHLCETRGCSAALHQLQPLSCLICCQKTFATHQIHFFPQRCAGEWPILATSRRALTPDFYVWYLTFAFTIVPLPEKSWSGCEGGRNKQRLQIELSKWIHSTHLTNSLKAVQTFIVAAFGLNGRRTFSLCFRGGGGLSGALCLFTSSSIVDFAWVWGECMSLRDGLAAGVGTTSTPLSPGDFLRHKHTRTHTQSVKRWLWENHVALIMFYIMTQKIKICSLSMGKKKSHSGSAL